LVRQVQDIISQRNRDENEVVDYAKLSGHEFKIREMEQQVCSPCLLSRGWLLVETGSLINLCNRSRSCSSRIIWRRLGRGSARCGRCRIRNDRVGTSVVYGCALRSSLRSWVLVRIYSLCAHRTLIAVLFLPGSGVLQSVSIDMYTTTLYWCSLVCPLETHR